MDVGEEEKVRVGELRGATVTGLLTARRLIKPLLGKRRNSYVPGVAGMVNVQKPDDLADAPAVWEQELV